MSKLYVAIACNRYTEYNDTIIAFSSSPNKLKQLLNKICGSGFTCNIYETGTTFSTNNINKAKFIETYEKANCKNNYKVY